MKFHNTIVTLILSKFSLCLSEETTSQKDSVGIYFPSNLLEDKSVNWKNAIYWNQNLHSLSSDRNIYAKLTRASDENDLYAYENWFYGE